MNIIVYTNKNKYNFNNIYKIMIYFVLKKKNKVHHNKINHYEFHIKKINKNFILS